MPFGVLWVTWSSLGSSRGEEDTVEQLHHQAGGTAGHGKEEPTALFTVAYSQCSAAGCPRAAGLGDEHRGGKQKRKRVFLHVVGLEDVHSSQLTCSAEDIQGNVGDLRVKLERERGERGNSKQSTA